MTNKLYSVGDVVWYASFGTMEEQVPCPVCYGNKNVVVVLGNGDEVEVGCNYCSRGYDGALGYVTEYVLLPRAEQCTITRRRIEDDFGEEKVEYNSARYFLSADRIFDTYEEAMACAEGMAERKRLQDENSPKYKNEKSYAWNAGYHLKQADKCHREAIYHEAKAKVCKSRAKSKE